MDVTGIARLATNMSAERNDQAVGIAVLKKALDVESSNAAMLLQAIPSVRSSSSLPPNLGQNINTVA